MSLSFADLSEEVRAYVGEVRRLVLPPQGMTSEVAVLETGTGPFVVKRARQPLFMHWLTEEFRVLQALRPLALPIPQAHHFVRRSTAEGDECWLVMDYLHGTTLAKALSAEPDTSLRRHLVRQWGAVLARLHATPAPSELVPRGGSWLDDRLQQARYNLTRYAVDGDAQLLDWLDAHRPLPVDHALIHGDFTLDNTLVNDGKIVGLIDWGFGALGDPRYDLALALDPEPGVFDSDAERAEFWAGYGPRVGTQADYDYFHHLYEFF